MARCGRHKSEESAFYHLFNRVAGSPRYFPFRNPRVARKFLSLFEFYLSLYFCRLVAFQLMENHYHSIVHFEKFRKLKMDELQERARLRWGRRWNQKTRYWQPSDWQQFNRNLFDVSKFMQHVDGEFAKWFNRRYGRRGHFWADRFKNPELLDLESLLDCLLYIELNAVRAGLVRRPEDWKMGSAYWRWTGKKQHLLIGLEELFEAEGGQSSFQIYRALLYYRGAVATEQGQGVIPESVLQREQKRGFSGPGIFRRHLRFFNDGVALGSPQRLRELLEEYREKGHYRRRRHPIPQLGGRFFSLREQRSHAWSPG
ncbi:MAG: transposase [Acidobacteriota bacterium]